MEALHIQTRLCAECTQAEGKQRWSYDYSVKRLLVREVVGNDGYGGNEVLMKS